MALSSVLVILETSKDFLSLCCIFVNARSFLKLFINIRTDCLMY